MVRFALWWALMITVALPSHGWTRGHEPQANARDLVEPLHEAIALHNAAEFERLLRPTQAMTPFQKGALLELAIERCDPAIVKVLLKYGANWA